MSFMDIELRFLAKIGRILNGKAVFTLGIHGIYFDWLNVLFIAFIGPEINRPIMFVYTIFTI